MKKESLLEKIKKFPHEYSLIIALIGFSFGLCSFIIRLINLQLTLKLLKR